jgi:hypothetical protein
VTTESRRPAALEPPDDAAIEQLVRDAAEAWTMPPIRLDRPTWRDRVRSPRARRMAATRGWLGRVGQAATAAVALTVVAALVAIVLSSPPQGPGKSPAPSASGPVSPGPSRAATGSILPKLMVEGDLPSPTRLLVQAESDWALVDLDKGEIAGFIPDARYGSAILARSDGTLVCLCFSDGDRVNGSATRIDVRLDRFDADGKRTATTPVETFTGAPDPRDSNAPSFDSAPHVQVALSFSEAGRYGFVGWSARSDGAWHSGVLAVDVVDGSVVSRLELPDTGSGEGERRTVVDGPRLVGSVAGGELLVARTIVDWSSANMAAARPSFGGDVFRVPFGAGRWGPPAAVPSTVDCGEAVIRGGGLEGGGVWLACSDMGGSKVTLRRIDGEGRPLGDVTSSRGGAISGDTTAMSADGRSMFAWDPIAAQLARIDVATGEKALGPASAGAAPDPGPLAAFGQWLAPATAAKSYLQSAIVVSPDGRRVYALGVTNGASERDMSGSSGVYAFDTATLEPAGHWDATADFVSLALSPDGRFLYAAGTPGVDAAGRSLVNQAASITVFEAATGAQRLIAGQLGRVMLLFPGPVLD